LLAEFFALLGNPTRVRMFCELRDGPRTVSELARSSGVSLQNASQHLRVMRDRGAVTTEKQGHHVYYRIVDARFVQGAKMIHAALVEAMRRKMDSVGAV
jgi:ArsR family transcriptional regulator